MTSRDAAIAHLLTAICGLALLIAIANAQATASPPAPKQQQQQGVCSAQTDCLDKCQNKYKQEPGTYPSLNMNRYNVFHIFYPLFRIIADAYFMLINALFWLYNSFQPIENVGQWQNASNLLFLSATKAAAQLRDRKIKSGDLVQAYIARAKAVQPVINAIVYQNFDAALKQATQADQQLDKMTPEQRAQLYQKQPLFGVPFTSKNNLLANGFRITACNQAYINATQVSTRDAEVVKNMKNAGAILLAITNMPNLGLSTYCDDSACGIANNPHDSRRTTGGSSSGEAALITSAGSLLGLGNDIGGSLRIPSSYCGVFGLKPTSYPTHTVSLDGIIPDFAAYKPAGDMLTNGPICRYAEDLPLALSILAGRPLNEYNISVDFAKYFRLFYMEDMDVLLMESLHSEQRSAVRKVKNYFEQTYNLTVPQIKFPIMNRVLELLALNGLSPGVIPLYPNLTSIFWQLYNSKPGQMDTTFAIWEINVMSNFLHPKDDAETAFVTAKYAKLRQQVSTFLGRDGVLVMPIVPAPVPFHHSEPYKTFNLFYAAVNNILGFPALAVPIGKSVKTGMPYGVQILGAPSNEALLIAVGRELEKAFGGWVAPGTLPPQARR